MTRLLIPCVALLVCAVAAFAVPPQIHYQGSLTRPDGTPLDTTVAMTFTLHTAPVWNAAVWTEVHPAVAVVNGAFNVKLGDVNPLADSLFGDNVRWLSVQVGGDPEMTPRQQVLSSVWALRVGSVDGAAGGLLTSDVTITDRLNVGSDNSNPGAFAVVAGQNNHARGDYSAIGGGGGAVAADSNSTNGALNAIGGGRRNATADSAATVGGGASNTASGRYSTVGGGQSNRASFQHTTVGGGYNNTASNGYCTVGGGVSNTASNWTATVSGGEQNLASGWGSTISGGVVNVASGPGAAIGGGEGHDAIGSGTTISGGAYNLASGDYSAVSGGYSNVASGVRSTVVGGHDNDAAGNYSTAAGGIENQAVGTASFAAGYRARAIHSGSFVWSSTGVGTEVTESFGVFTFTARCANGARFYTSQTGTATGISLPGGGGAWANLCDVNQKRLHGDVNTADVLRRVSSLPLHRWSYKAQDESVQHIGPTAQDFHAAFGLGDDNTTISTLDPDGVALAAIQELAKRLEVLEADNTRLKTLLELRTAAAPGQEKEE